MSRIKMFIGLVIAAMLWGCSPTKSTYTKTPVLLGDQLAETFDLNMDGLAGEGLLWDNYNKNVVLFSTKDEALEGVSMNIGFGGNGEMSSMALDIGRKTAVSSTPSDVAWSGLRDVLIATYGEDGLNGVLKSITEGLVSGAIPNIGLPLPEGE